MNEIANFYVSYLAFFVFLTIFASKTNLKRNENKIFYDIADVGHSGGRYRQKERCEKRIMARRYGDLCMV